MVSSDRLCTRVIALSVTLALACVLSRSAIAEGDPWYADVGGHWAYEYIRTLWEEGVTDGKIVTVRRDGRQRRESRYLPSDGCTRGQYAMMLSKAFRLTPESGSPVFPDVPENYRIFDKPAYGYIQAAARAGLIVGYPNGLFMPDSSTTREQAFAILVRALGLDAYAQEIPDNEVSQILRPFKDRHSISGAFWRQMAAAVRLKIVEGYPDGTLRPRQNVTRAEAATVVYRSCMVTASADPPRFSPDGDGVHDTTDFTLATLRNRNATAWSLYVTDYSGNVLRSFHPVLGTGAPPATVTWDGCTGSRRTLPDGTYYYRARVQDRNGNVFWSVLKPVTLVSRLLWGSVSPPTVQPGDQAGVTAHAQGEPLTVLYSSPWTRQQNLKREGEYWRGSIKIPQDTPDGEYELPLRAVYDDTTRDATTRITVFQYISLGCTLDPNPCRAGSTVTVTALASPCVVAATASSTSLGVPRFDLAATPGRDGEWTGRFRVADDCPPGRYAVTLTGRSLTKTAEATVYLTVDEPPLDSVGFVLVD